MTADERSRTDVAIEAAAKAFHENAREKRQFTWEQSSDEWRRDIRNFVRPMVEAALAASDEFIIDKLQRDASGADKPMPEIAKALQTWRRRNPPVDKEPR